SALAPLFLTAGLLAFTLGGVVAVVLARRPGWARPATYGACALGGALTAAAGLAGLDGEPWHWSRPGLLPPPGVELSVDGLAAFFLVLVGGAAGPPRLLAGMLLLAHFAGSARFADWPGVTATLPPGLRALAFALLALGFGSKAGLVPLHVWLPLAHPAAPSHVSALMSGVMIKL